jgi:hypothetical protein
MKCQDHDYLTADHSHKRIMIRNLYEALLQPRNHVKCMKMRSMSQNPSSHF